MLQNFNNVTPSKTLFWFCIAFIVGIGLYSLIKIPQIYIWGILFTAILMIMAHFLITQVRDGHNRYLVVLGFCVLFVVLGIARLQISEFNAENDKLIKFNNNPEKIILTGKIINEPDIRSSYQKLKLKIKNMESVVLVTVGSYPKYSYLDEIKVTGYLKTPPEFEDFNYKNYLLKDGIYSVMDFPKVALTSKKHTYTIFSFLYEQVVFLKEKLRSSINVNFPSPQNSMVDGIVFGNNKDMPKDLKDRFNATGLSHITAVSGGNIVVLISMLVVILLSLGLWRQQALYFSIILVWIYIILVGFPASGIRAGIMGSIFLFAQALGRQNTSSRTIVLAGSLMLLQNPLLLLYDIGFQLSFLASMGIIHVKPIFDHFLQFKKEAALHSQLKNIFSQKLKDLTDIVSITLAAQISTLPIIIYNFGTISLIAPITNFLILPIVPFLMVFGFLASIFGIFSGFLGWVFALPCYALIFYVLKILEVFHQPWATKSFENIYWGWFLIYYIVLMVLVWFFKKKLKPKFLGY